MNTNMQFLEAERKRLEAKERPLISMRFALQHSVQVALLDDKTED